MSAPGSRRALLTSRPVFSWALYDWANSAYATTVMAAFFPIFFREYWSSGGDPTVTTLRLGAANSIASLAIAVMAPVLGAIADRGGMRKRMLMTFAFLGILMCTGLYFVAEGHWVTAVWLYVLGTAGFALSIVFNDSLLVDITEDKHFDLVSAFGFAMGYLGGGLLYIFNVLMVKNPDMFGMTTATAVKVSFLSVAVWWLVFMLPLLFFVKERKPAQPESVFAAIGGGIRQLVATFNEIRALSTVALFLLAYWLYIDGVNTVIKMATDYGLSLGFDSGDLIVALLITQFVGFPATLAFGFISTRVGTKNVLFFSIGVYLLLTIWASRMTVVSEFYAMAAIIGLVQGSIQSLSRSFYARLVPENKSAEFFGFYNMVGRFAAIFGPILVGWTAYATGNPRAGLLAIVLLFAGGALILAFVNEKAGIKHSHELEAV